MMDWDRVRVFHAVAQAGSFTRAAERLGLSQSAISRQIGALEEDLGTPLFHRHARGLVLTEQGEILLHTANEVAKRMASVQTALGESRDSPAGHLRDQRHDRAGHGVAGGAIARLRRAPSGDHHLAGHRRQRRGSQHARGRCRDSGGAADPAGLDPAPADDRPHAHLRLAGLPRAPWHPADCRGARSASTDRLWRCSSVPVASLNWVLSAGRGEDDSAPAAPAPTLSINNVFGMLRAAETGLGLASLPDYLGDVERPLQRVLDGCGGAEFHRLLRLSGGTEDLEAGLGIPRFSLEKVAEQPVW